MAMMHWQRQNVPYLNVIKLRFQFMRWYYFWLHIFSWSGNRFDQDPGFSLFVIVIILISLSLSLPSPHSIQNRSAFNQICHYRYYTFYSSVIILAPVDTNTLNGPVWRTGTTTIIAISSFSSQWLRASRNMSTVNSVQCVAMLRFTWNRTRPPTEITGCEKESRRLTATPTHITSNLIERRTSVNLLYSFPSIIHSRIIVNSHKHLI